MAPGPDDVSAAPLGINGNELPGAGGSPTGIDEIQRCLKAVAALPGLLFEQVAARHTEAQREALILRLEADYDDGSDGGP